MKFTGSRKFPKPQENINHLIFVGISVKEIEIVKENNKNIQPSNRNGI